MITVASYQSNVKILFTKKDRAFDYIFLPPVNLAAGIPLLAGTCSFQNGVFFGVVERWKRFRVDKF